MRFKTAQPPQWPSPSSVASMMRIVILALLPAILVSAWFYGPGVFFNIIVAIIAAIATEALALRLRQKPIVATLSDGSAIVAAMLFAFSLPPLCPWWVTASGIVFAIGVVKHAYGGLGYNLFNPAMAGYVLVLVSFPELMTGWPEPDIGDLDYQRPGFGATLQYCLTGTFPDALTLDAVTRATTLDSVREGLGAMRTMDEIRINPVFGDFGGAGWEWVSNFVAMGGAALLLLGIIRWHVPAGVLGGLLGMASFVWLLDPQISPSPGFPSVQRRRDARRLFHCHRSGLLADYRTWPAHIWRRHRRTHLHHPHLGQLCRRHRLCRAADEHGGTAHRTMDPPAHLRQACLMSQHETDISPPASLQRAAWRAVLSLAGFAALVGLVVGLAWDATRERIADNEAQRVLAELSAVLPPALYDNEPHRDFITLDLPGDEPRQIWRARRDGVAVAAVLTSLAPDGYSGQIRLLVAISTGGQVLGVRVASHSETPGIGDAIDTRKSPWISTFTGRSLGNPEETRWRLRKDGGDFDAISGATISSRAVVAATRRTMQYFHLYREQIFAAPAATTESTRLQEAREPLTP